MILTIFQTFSFVHNDLTQVNPKILNQETLHRFVYQYHPASHMELPPLVRWGDWHVAGSRERDGEGGDVIVAP
jgi:hypothetical protein